MVKYISRTKKISQAQLCLPFAQKNGMVCMRVYAGLKTFGGKMALEDQGVIESYRIIQNLNVSKITKENVDLIVSAIEACSKKKFGELVEEVKVLK